MPRRAVRSAGPSAPGAEGVVGGPPEGLDHSRPPVAERGVGEKAGDLPVKDASGQGALGDAHPLLVAEREAGQLLCPRVAGGAVAPRRPGLSLSLAVATARRRGRRLSSRRLRSTTWTC